MSASKIKKKRSEGSLALSEAKQSLAKKVSIIEAVAARPQAARKCWHIGNLQARNGLKYQKQWRIRRESG